MLVCRKKVCKEETAGQAGKYQHGDVRKTATRAGHRAGDRGKDFANAQIVRSIQERRRLAGNSRPWPKAPRKKAKVFDGRKTGRHKTRRATIGAPSACRKATIRAHHST